MKVVLEVDVLLLRVALWLRLKVEFEGGFSRLAWRGRVVFRHLIDRIVFFNVEPLVVGLDGV